MKVRQSPYVEEKREAPLPGSTKKTSDLQKRYQGGGSHTKEDVESVKNKALKEEGVPLYDATLRTAKTNPKKRRKEARIQAAAQHVATFLSRVSCADSASSRARQKLDATKLAGLSAREKLEVYRQALLEAPPQELNVRFEKKSKSGRFELVGFQQVASFDIDGPADRTVEATFEIPMPGLSSAAKKRLLEASCQRQDLRLSFSLGRSNRTTFRPRLLLQQLIEAEGRSIADATDVKEMASRYAPFLPKQWDSLASQVASPRLFLRLLDPLHQLEQHGETPSDPYTLVARFLGHEPAQRTDLTLSVKERFLERAVELLSRTRPLILSGVFAPEVFTEGDLERTGLYLDKLSDLSLMQSLASDSSDLVERLSLGAPPITNETLGAAVEDEDRRLSNYMGQLADKVLGFSREALEHLAPRWPVLQEFLRAEDERVAAEEKAKEEAKPKPKVFPTRAEVAKRFSVLPKRFRSLANDPGIATRASAFIAFAKVHSKQHPSATKAAVRAAFAEELGSVTYYRGLALTEDQAEAIKAHGMRSNYLRAGHDEKEAAKRFATEELGAIITDHTSAGEALKNSPLMSVSTDPSMAAMVARGQLESDEQNVYVFTVSVPVIDTIEKDPYESFALVEVPPEQIPSFSSASRSYELYIPPKLRPSWDRL